MQVQQRAEFMPSAYWINLVHRAAVGRPEGRCGSFFFADRVVMIKSYDASLSQPLMRGEKCSVSVDTAMSTQREPKRPDVPLNEYAEITVVIALAKAAIAASVTPGTAPSRP